MVRVRARKGGAPNKCGPEGPSPQMCKYDFFVHPHEKFVKCNKLTNSTKSGTPNVTALPNHIVFLDCHRWPQDHHADQTMTTPARTATFQHRSYKLCPQAQKWLFHPGFGFCDETQEHGCFCAASLQLHPRNTQSSPGMGPTSSGHVRSLCSRAAWWTPSRAAAPRRTVTLWWKAHHCRVDRQLHNFSNVATVQTSPNRRP